MINDILSPEAKKHLERLVIDSLGDYKRYYNVYLIPKKREKGVSPYKDNDVHPLIHIIPGKLLRVKDKTYEFSGGQQWEVVNRFLKSIRNNQKNIKGNYPVRFDSNGYNKCHGKCRAFINDWVARARSSGKGNTQYLGFARFKIENLEK